MRLDKFLTQTLGITRREAAMVLKAKRIEVNGEIVKQAAMKLTDQCVVTFDDRPLSLKGPQYYMLNKPAGFVCSHVDDHNPTVFVLLDEVSPEKLHVAGRLDGDTTGLVLLTDDGQWSHRVTSPRHHCEKVYRVTLADPVPESAIAEFANGMQLRQEKELTLPAKLVLLSETEALLTISEGKYHQVKRMFAALGNRVVALHREQVGELVLDADLAAGEYRPLTDAEIASFLA